MISFIFAITKLQKKKLKEIVQNRRDLIDYKIFKFKNNTIRAGKNYFDFVFNPIQMDILTFVQILYPDISFSEENLGKTIDDLYKKELLQEYSLSLTTSVKPTLVEILIKQGRKESVIVDNYANLLYNYIVRNCNELELLKEEQFKVVKLVVASNTRRIALLIKDNIIREISQLRSPPNSVCQGLLSAA